MDIDKIGKFSVSFYNVTRDRLFTFKYVSKVRNVFNYIVKNYNCNGVLLLYNRSDGKLICKYKYNHIYKTLTTF